MLANNKMMGFALTKDYEKSRAFYEGKLGFTFLSQDQFAMVLRAGENMIRVSKVANFTPLQSTALGWEVADIEAMVAWLKKRGVVFEKYPFIQDQELGIWNAPGGGGRVAWFKDPDGNVLSVSQHT